jgi:UDP-glucose:(heptosyl)LPS alpha-1,3-glucosyltransferase
MGESKLNIGFVRRGFSRSGGAEAYLRRLARGVVAAGHQATLFTTLDWPEQEWPSGAIVRLSTSDPIHFADELVRIDPWKQCDQLVSFERVWRCDFFRAGDGVHRVWLERRARDGAPWRKLAHGLNRTHGKILRLEEALLGNGGARHVIANSKMVRDEIIREYGYSAEAIEVIPNGVRVSEFGPSPMKHQAARAELNLAADDVAVLFAGSGWERKGLRFAIAAVEQLDDVRLRLLVAGRGPERKYRSRRARFIGEIDDIRMLLAAADIFILPTLYDPFSNASLEAMAAGLPVITTRANGCSEIIEETIHGSIVERADDVGALVKALRLWSEEPRRRNARGAILERATQFDLSRNVAQTLKLLLQAEARAAATSGKMRNT